MGVQTKKKVEERCVLPVKDGGESAPRVTIRRHSPRQPIAARPKRWATPPHPKPPGRRQPDRRGAYADSRKGRGSEKRVATTIYTRPENEQRKDKYKQEQ